MSTRTDDFIHDLCIWSTVQSVHVCFRRITSTIFSFIGFLLIGKVELRIVPKECVKKVGVNLLCESQTFSHVLSECCVHQ